MVRSFFLFHVYFTIQRILFELGRPASVFSLPEDPNFKKENNKYYEKAYHEICDKFGINKASDFRYTQGFNDGLGTPYIYVTGYGADVASKTEYLLKYPGGFFKFSDDGKYGEPGGQASKGNLIYYLQTKDAAKVQPD